MNQKQNGNTWMSLGTYVLAPGQNHRVVLGDVANGDVTADVMKFVPVDEATVTWPIASIPANGNYKVYAKWPASSGNASDATYIVTHGGGSTPVTVNQKTNGGQWTLLGTFAFDAGTPGYKVALSGDGNGQVAADAIYYANDNAVPDSFTWTPSLPTAGDYAVYAKWPTGAVDSGTAVYTIAHDGGVASHSVSQRANGGEWVWLGTYAMDPANDPEVMLAGANDGAVYADAVRFVSGDAIGGDIAYSHGDQLGTIQKLTDASGALVWDRIARPFGETVSINAASGVDQKLRFPGQYADETGLSYNYFRDYDSTLGRYVQSDPIGLTGGINTYAYVAGNPIGRRDLLGLITDTEHVQRNRHNKCPEDEPTPGEVDCQGNVWEEDNPISGWIFHGGNDTYRSPEPGTSGGYQCSYDDEGNLDTSGDDRGTYDYVRPDQSYWDHFWEDVEPDFTGDPYEDPDQTEVYDCSDCDL